MILSLDKRKMVSTSKSFVYNVWVRDLEHRGGCGHSNWRMCLA